MAKCIICLKDNIKPSIEHVFPEALGGKIKLRDCCKKCNSSLGSYIDNRLTNDSFIELARFILKIGGKNGIINPFKTPLNSPFKGINGHLKFDKYRKFKGFEIIHKKLIDTDDKVVIACDNSKMSGMLKTLNQKLEKNNQVPITMEQLKKNTRKFNIGAPSSIKIEINKKGENGALTSMFPSFIKIGYELGYQKLGETYLEDEIACNMRKLFIELFNKNENVSIPTDIEIDGYNWGNLTKDLEYNFEKSDDNYYININIFNLIKAKILLTENIEKYNGY